jgi:uncharacterized lipoprotein YddW (UPF0748 family)
MTRLITLSFAVLSHLILISVHSDARTPKREMRAAWLTTAWGLDWPDTKIPEGGGEYYIRQQKQQMISILDSMKLAGMNAVFFQVRPECDAMYKSSYEPWSAHLVSRRGMDPGYDPLQFAIDESHKRGLELHAWLNPFRFESVSGKYAGLPGNYNKTNPDWVLKYSQGSSILDPGNPAVRKRISDIVREIVVNYDVDGIVFDDYFYAYGGTPASIDLYSQQRWKPVGKDLHDWRRENINQAVADVYYTVKDVKPWVTFGVSPFGIWTLDSQIAAANDLTLPQGITGLDAYKTIYSDPVAWLREGIVDYISPQLYWPTTSVGQDYKKLAPWWSDVANRFGRHNYVSQSLIKLVESDFLPPGSIKPALRDCYKSDLHGLSLLEYNTGLKSHKMTNGYDPLEYGKQIQYNRNSDKAGAPGSVFFRSTMFFKKGFMNYLRTHEYSTLALPPVKAWHSAEMRKLPSNLRLKDHFIVWDSEEENVRFSVYAVPNHLVKQPDVFQDGKYLLGISYSPFFDLSGHYNLLNMFSLAVSVLDRYGNEFPPVIMRQDVLNKLPVAMISPTPEQNVIAGFQFNPEAVNPFENCIPDVVAGQAFPEIVRSLPVAGFSVESGGAVMEQDSVFFSRGLTLHGANRDTILEIREAKIISSAGRRSKGNLTSQR